MPGEGVSEVHLSTVNYSHSIMGTINELFRVRNGVKTYTNCGFLYLKYCFAGKNWVKIGSCSKVSMGPKIG